MSDERDTQSEVPEGMVEVRFFVGSGDPRELAAKLDAEEQAEREQAEREDD